MTKKLSPSDQEHANYAAFIAEIAETNANLRRALQEHFTMFNMGSVDNYRFSVFKPVTAKDHQISAWLREPQLAPFRPKSRRTPEEILPAHNTANLTPEPA
jgi:hypothetical protein